MARSVMWPTLLQERGSRRHLQTQRRHAVHGAQEKAESIQALSSNIVSAPPDAGQSMPMRTMIRLPKLDATMAPPPTAKAITCGGSGVLRGQTAPHPAVQQPRPRRTAIQAKLSDISPEATGRKGLLILSMLMS